MPLKSVMKRGGAYGFLEGVKTQYDALLALLEESVNAGEVKMRTRWLAKEVAEIPPPKNADTAMLLELNDRVEVVAELGEEQGSTRERNSQLQSLISRPFSTRFG